MIKSTAALAACLALIAFVAPTPAQAFTATAHASLTDLCKNKDGKEATEKPAGATSITFGKDCESGCKGKKGEKTEKDPVSITFGKDCDSGCKGKKGEKTETDAG